MISSYLPIFFLLILAIVFPVGLLLTSTFIGPRLEMRNKFEPYECGVPAKGSAHGMIPVKYYRLAILFVLFDVEAAFLFPWAVLFRPKLEQWGAPFLILEIAIFLLILLAGYFYVWKRGGLEWD